jgi:DNA transposition AAA+ family ATPase
MSKKISVAAHAADNSYFNTSAYKDDVASIKQSMDTLEMSAAQLCRLAGFSTSALSDSLAGKYTGDAKSVIKKSLQALARSRAEKINAGVMPFAPTSIYKMIKYLCDEAFANRTTDSIGLATGYVGLGKSTALLQYVHDNSHVIYIRCSTRMTPKAVLNRLRSELRATSDGKTIIDVQECVVAALQKRPKLIILDEGSKAKNDVLEVLRDISDESECGLMLVGRESLFDRLSSNTGELGEISSRILSRIDPFKCLLDSDVHLILDAGVLSGASEASKSMILKCSENNGRVLKHIIIKLANWIKRHGIEQLSPDVVSQTFNKTIEAKSAAWYNHAA